jgi:hypothetical protein
LGDSRLDWEAQDAEEFAVNEALPHAEEVKLEAVMAEVHDREEAEAKGPAINVPGAPSVVDAEAAVEDPRSPAEANQAEYDRTWSTKFESKCPDGYALYSQEEGGPVVYKTKRGNRNSSYHLEFEPCKLPAGHRDRVRVKCRTRSLGAAVMSLVHRDAHSRDSFATVDLEAYTRWMSSRGNQFVPKFCQGCCHSKWDERPEVESSLVE